jgi:acetyltransferase-like isoleucine patch superfamily enzyme
VVTRDLPPFFVAAGAPAKVLRRVEYGEAQPPGGEQLAP